MAKYSTGGGGGGGDGDSCELCGRTTAKLRHANVEGAQLLVCPDCAPHDDNRHKDQKKRDTSSQRDDGEPNRRKRAAQRTAKMYDQSKGDSSHWEKKGTNYEKDRLPYLVSGYGGVVESAREDADLTAAELAEELDVPESDIAAIEEGRAARANVGGSVIRALEDRLDVVLVDE
ncbi:ribosome-binding protein aMBF1, putative translation factor, contains Zn-ribbon and HTH domains [Halopelagius inordinatus]|uniref:Ribosome-binding protein aMBF1, putative translation factor, contains Zn-ribbon and HTH domains n=1 Tax=Halopelagius inordinatus TaxID=553467 RepID=A0A1I2RFB7_9EURY|nr:multiprotein-bridging factor 1 family protein [Halopelagius inordinatus]SFG39384.1 ribosome-binding protein aMBF1, putative translation factor, contains Zn-ribbon and HTH domains [Halopelagius inordinatus]